MVQLEKLVQLVVNGLNRENSPTDRSSLTGENGSTT